MMEIKIRKMVERDIREFPQAFSLQGWNKPVSQFQTYFEEQENGKRQLFIATVDGKVAGYATILPHDKSGPFKDMDIPVINDLNILEKYQKNGVGTALMDYIENFVKEYSSTICLSVGLHSGYGSAQRMYVKRGYIPDGSGVWFNGEQWKQYEPCVKDDELVLYLSKSL